MIYASLISAFRNINYMWQALNKEANRGCLSMRGVLFKLSEWDFEYRAFYKFKKWFAIENG